MLVWKIDVRNGPLASTYRMKENTGDEVHHLDLRLAAGLRRHVGQDGRNISLVAEDFAAMGAFMEAFNKELAESGELVETRGLAAPVLTRRVQLQNGVPVVTDGPYAETNEVLAGYWVVECESFDRATDIAARLSGCPAPEAARARGVADVRPLAESRAELEI